MKASIHDRGRDLFEQHHHDVLVRSDRLFAVLMVVQWLAGIVVALVYSPTAWDGEQSRVHVHVWGAVVLGAAISGVPVLLAVRRPGWVGTRHAVAVGQMLTSALLIHLTGGRIETHFHVFGSLAFLAFYRDWRILITATVVVALDHALRGLFWPESVYGVAFASLWRTVEHAFWVVFEDVVLVLGCLASLREMRTVAEHRAALEDAHARLGEKERLERELEIAGRIQTSVLPRLLRVDGLEIAARMIPANEVGGDYYEILPVEGGCWLGIGDVSGHGLTAGLVMMMMQSSIASLGRTGSSLKPSELLTVVNSVLYENVRNRIADDSHATLSVLRYRDDGTLTFAGAHEDILVSRADGHCDVIETPGPWVGAVKNLGRSVVDTTQRLEQGDVMVLYTDGVTEAMNADREQFGIDRLRGELTAARDEPVEVILARLVETVQRWTFQQEDDITLVVIRRVAMSVTAESPSGSC